MGDHEKWRLIHAKHPSGTALENDNDRQFNKRESDNMYLSHGLAFLPSRHNARNISNTKKARKLSGHLSLESHTPCAEPAW